MSNKDWDSWKRHNDYTARNILRYEAEREQITTKPMGVKGYQSIYVRDVYIGGCPDKYKVRLRLGDHRPVVTIDAPEGVITFIANLETDQENDKGRMPNEQR